MAEIRRCRDVDLGLKLNLKLEFDPGGCDTRLGNQPGIQPETRPLRTACACCARLVVPQADVDFDIERIDQIKIRQETQLRMPGRARQQLMKQQLRHVRETDPEMAAVVVDLRAQVSVFAQAMPLAPKT